MASTSTSTSTSGGIVVGSLAGDPFYDQFTLYFLYNVHSIPTCLVYVLVPSLTRS
ncbi:hypothetical protein ISN44_As01g034080 [Arabidopsis suecica]|uniref:Transmembrane protein n=2 Tax=Arabidopsis TaxID=3701 RepID=B3H4R7_ARATH|nr:uncharacterized protein AT1G35181 [Arabidopsis thaliana]AEE31764.1 transmembrane protein [Arabidopsis thaliana]KAG7656410.1 hypothetical protein ISN44_As01g034080 [Arabidopsis suecica]|eukprot:NP_001117413.1 transmembrane protein [Arabidopsis thaliana]